MILLYQIGVWVCFAALILYTILYGRNEEKMDGKVFLIRKIWYLFYIFGALIYWTQYPDSIFSEWENYLIVVIIFFGVDAFIFLNMYLKRAGNYELDRFTNTVSANENLIQDHLSMTKNMLHTLNNEGIIGYYGTKEAYLLGLKDVLESYAEKENMTINLLPFTTSSEKERSLLSFSNPDSIRSKLDREETVYNAKEKYALHPVYLFDDEFYVLKITGERPISEMDCLLFVVMIHIYDFAIPEEGDFVE